MNFRNQKVNNRTRVAFTLVELLVVITIIGILAALLMPALARSKAKAYNTACLNNLRQLAIATRLYSSDNDERLPSAEILPTQPVDPAKPLPRICDVLANYVGKGPSGNLSSSTVFKCPGDKLGRFTAEGSSYEWNYRLNGHQIDQTQHDNAFLLRERGNPAAGISNLVLRFPPETTAMFLDYDPVHPRRPDFAKNVAFMDGHVGSLEIKATPANP